MRCQPFLLRTATIILSVLSCLPVFARGIIEGTVADRDGNPVTKVRVLIAPTADAELRTYTLKTNAKGKFFVMVNDGNYSATLEDEAWALDSMTIRVETRRKDSPGGPATLGKLHTIFDWSGKVVPGQDPTPIAIGPEDRATVDLVVASREVLREERAELLLGRTAAALRRGDRATAMRAVDDLLATTPDDPLGLTLRAYIRAQEGRNAEAEVDLLLALEQEPDLYDARYQLAAIYRDTGRTTEAVETFLAAAQATENGAQKSKALLSIGEMERDAGNTDRAIELLEQAVEANSDLRSTVAPELANLYTSVGDIDRAAAWLETADAEEVDPALQYNVGVVHFNKKEWPPAAECFRKVLAADPDFADAHRNLATALLNLDQREESLEHFRRYLALRPDAEDAGQIQALVDHLSK